MVVVSAGIKQEDPRVSNKEGETANAVEYAEAHKEGGNCSHTEVPVYVGLWQRSYLVCIVVVVVCCCETKNKAECERAQRHKKRFCCFFFGGGGTALCIFCCLE